MNAATYALFSVLTFSTAAIGFTYFARKVSPLWMNSFKCVVALICCVIGLMLTGGTLEHSLVSAWPFILSGVIGLNFADWLLFSAYKRMGPARTLVLAGFQPLMAGGFSYFVWGEKVFAIQLVAIVFLIGCLFLFSYEGFKRSGQWETQGLIYALCGVFLDCVGVLITRYGFKSAPQIDGIEGNYLRILGAFASFIVLWALRSNGWRELRQGFAKLSQKELGIAVVASFFGTFLSLVFYLEAIKIGPLALVTSVVLADPMMSTLFECLWVRAWPSGYLWLALGSFALAMVFVFMPQILGL